MNTSNAVLNTGPKAVIDPGFDPLAQLVQITVQHSQQQAQIASLAAAHTVQAQLTAELLQQVQQQREHLAHAQSALLQCMLALEQLQQHETQRPAE